MVCQDPSFHLRININVGTCCDILQIYQICNCQIWTTWSFAEWRHCWSLKQSVTDSYLINHSFCCNEITLWFPACKGFQNASSLLSLSTLAWYSTKRCVAQTIFCHMWWHRAMYCKCNHNGHRHFGRCFNHNRIFTISVITCGRWGDSPPPSYRIAIWWWESQLASSIRRSSNCASCNGYVRRATSEVSTWKQPVDIEKNASYPPVVTNTWSPYQV